jgi:uncharacterized protein (TIGR03435 family)
MSGLLANPQLKLPLRMVQLVFVLCIVFALLGSLAPLCGAQALASSSPRFIVATIKPSDPNRAEADGSVGFTPSGSFDAKSQSLKEIIEFVQNIGYYKVDQRIVGGPKWLGSSKFDIEAKCDEETVRAFGRMQLKQQILAEQTMVQALLVDRFKLRTHHELRRLPVYALVQPKSGSKMKLSGKTGEDELGDADGPPGNWKATGVTMKVLANELSSLPEFGGKIVVDRTGLKGRFDFVIRWTPDPTMGAAPPGADDGLKSDSSAPSLLTALQEQLGLKLESTKEPVDVIVIDSAELPTPN